MNKLIGFIDYFPGESGFVTPVFSDFNENFYIEKNIHNQVNVFYLDDNFQQVIVRHIKQQVKLIEDLSFILIKKPILNDESSDFLYAFKFTKDLIFYGDRESVSKKILLGIGTIDDRLTIYNELVRFVSKTEIKVDKMIAILLANYTLEKYFEYQNKTFLMHSTELYSDIEMIEMVFHKKRQLIMKIIKDGNELECFDEHDLIFRNLLGKTNRELNFKRELDRINKFKKSFSNLNKINS